MKRVLIVAAIVLAGCSGNLRQVTAPGPHSGSLAVVELEPTGGAFVDAGTVIKAKLAYSVPSGYPGKYMILAQFEELTEKRSTGGSASWSQAFDAAGGRGTISIECPLEHVIDRAEVAKPLKLRFLLTIMTASGRAESVAHVGPIQYEVR